MQEKDDFTKECKIIASNTGTIIDRDQNKRKMLEYFL